MSWDADAADGVNEEWFHEGCEAWQQEWGPELYACHCIALLQCFREVPVV